MTAEQMFMALAGMVIAAYTILQLHRKHVEGEVDKAKEKSVGATAIAGVLKTITEHEAKLNDHDGRLTKMDQRQERMEKEYLDALKDIVHHYTSKHFK
jgi:hypothetical protein